jgi:hypothetical protein
MKRILAILSSLVLIFSVVSAQDDVSLKKKAEIIAADAGSDLGLSVKETERLQQLVFEKLDSTERQTRNISDPAKRSQIIKQIHREFTKKLYNNYDQRTSNKIEGWYYNYTNKNR